MAKKSKKVKSNPGGSVMSDKMESSVSVEKISNGYIVNESSYGPKGFKRKVTYSARNPVVMPPRISRRGKK
jgi:hypothetical protein